MVDLAELSQRLLRAYPGRRDEALAVINGAIGDRLADRGAGLAIDMGLFHGEGLWALDDPPLALPDARPTACLFVHGLMGSERAWRFGVRPPGARARGDGDGAAHDDGAAEDEADEQGPARVDYGAAISEARDATAVYVRYNTGRHISQNGRELAAKLERLHHVYPFAELDIVAHSMGGLVIRSACHYALEAGHAWVDRVARVFLLGVPSRGAPLEFLAHVTAFTLEQIWNPWTKIIGKVINLRSAGIKDLRHGFVLDEDWRHYDLDRLAYPVPARTEVPDQARWFVAVGALGHDESFWAKTVGDGLVRPPSAQGVSVDPREPELLPPAEVARFARTGHLALMNDPAVLEQILTWWALEPAGQLEPSAQNL